MTLYNNVDVMKKASSWMLHVEATFSHVRRRDSSQGSECDRHMIPNPVKLCQSVNFLLFSHCLVLATYRARAVQYPESLVNQWEESLRAAAAGSSAQPMRRWFGRDGREAGPGEAARVKLL